MINEKSGYKLFTNTPPVLSVSVPPFPFSFSLSLTSLSLSKDRNQHHNPTKALITLLLNKQLCVSEPAVRICRPWIEHRVLGYSSHSQHTTSLLVSGRLAHATLNYRQSESMKTQHTASDKHKTVHTQTKHTPLRTNRQHGFGTCVRER